MPTGANSYANFGFESSYGSPATCDKAFGTGLKLAPIDAARAISKSYGIGSFDAEALVEGKFAGGLTLDYDLNADGRIFRAIIGNSCTDAGGGPYTHTYPVSATIANNTPASMTIEEGLDLDMNGSFETKNTYYGVVVVSAKILAEVGDTPAHVTLTCVYAGMNKSVAGAGSKVVPPEAPFNFGMAAFQEPGGATISQIQRFEMDIKRNPILIWGLGSTQATALGFGNRDYEVNVVNLLDDSTLNIESWMGNAASMANTAKTIASIYCQFNNGLGTTYQRLMNFQFATVKINHYSHSDIITDAIMETIVFEPETLSLVVTNNTATG
jgi:hypothetical protein